MAPTPQNSLTAAALITGLIAAPGALAEALPIAAPGGAAGRLAGAAPAGTGSPPAVIGRRHDPARDLISADPQTASADPEAAAAGEVCVRGRLTDEGVECQAMRGADGRLYTLAGNLAELAPGAEACICGAVAELSTCMQGTTLAITRIAPAGACE